MKVNQKTLEKMVEKASKEFWNSIQKQCPELNPEKLDIGTIIVLQWQMKDAIERYLATGEE